MMGGGVYACVWDAPSVCFLFSFFVFFSGKEFQVYTKKLGFKTISERVDKNEEKIVPWSEVYD